jgi:hypothetical protein
MFKNMLRKVLERKNCRLTSLLREQMFLRQASRDQNLTEKVASALGIAALNTGERLRGTESSDTVFILAGGASVNRLTSANLDHIAKHASIGINFWPIHDFTPNSLSNETDNLSGGAPVAITFLSNKINDASSPYFGPSLITLRPPWPPNPLRMMQLTKKNDNPQFVYGRTNLITREERNLGGDLGRIVRRAVSHTLPQSVLPDNGSSVVRLTFLALTHGFSNIVYVGVDQSPGPYFWTEEPVPAPYQQAAKLFPRRAGEPHSTSSSENRPFSNDTFLRVLYRAVAGNSSSRIFLAEGESELADTIPLYDWDS